MKINEAVAADVPEPVLSEKSEVTRDGWAIALPKTRIHTLEQLIEFFEVDTRIWEVERFVANKWEVGAKVGSKNSKILIVEPLYQVKAFFRRRKDMAAALQEIEDLKEQAKREVVRKPSALVRVLPKTNAAESGNMLELDLFDAHFGKLAWDDETGHGHFDVKIIEASYRAAFHTLLERAPFRTFDEIWYVVGNDILHSDDAIGRTTAGTPLAGEGIDGRYHRTFATVRKLVVENIEDLRSRAKKVRVIMIPGNHDRLSVWHLGHSLECWFRQNTDVVIDNSPKYRKYHQWGKVMLGFTHGDKGKKVDYPLLMATEQPEMFGATAFREMHCGHTHTKEVDERCGVRVRTLPGLTGVDTWHADKGLVGNQQSAEAYAWNREEGLVGTAVYTRLEPKPELKKTA